MPSSSKILSHAARTSSSDETSSALADVVPIASRLRLRRTAVGSAGLAAQGCPVVNQCPAMCARVRVRMHAWRASCVSRVSCVSAAADSDLMALLQLTHLPFAWTKYRADRHPAVAPNTHRRNTRPSSSSHRRRPSCNAMADVGSAGLESGPVDRTRFTGAARCGLTGLRRLPDPCQ